MKGTLYQMRTGRLKGFYWKAVNPVPAVFHEVLGAMPEEELVEGLPPLRDLLSLDREPQDAGWATVLEDRGDDYGKCPWGVFVLEGPNKKKVMREIASTTGIPFKKRVIRSIATFLGISFNKK